MGFGLFGKLPQKRDFVSVNLPHAVLNPFETWLQQAVAASRNEMGGTWVNYYMVAPIWHFWLGPDVLGTTVAGALMPSVDQVGRYFPLSILYLAEPGETLAPPLLAPMDGWYGQLDQRLLSVLGDQPVEVNGLLAGLVPPGAVPVLNLAIAGAPPPGPTPEPAPDSLPEEPPEAVSATGFSSGANGHAEGGGSWDDPVETPPAPDPAPDALEDEPAGEPTDEDIEPAVAAVAVWDVPDSTAESGEPVAAVAAAAAEGPESVRSEDAADDEEADSEVSPASGSSPWDELPALEAMDFSAPKATGGSVPDGAPEFAPDKGGAPFADVANGDEGENAPSGNDSAGSHVSFAAMPDDGEEPEAVPAAAAALADYAPPPYAFAPPQLAASEFKGGVAIAVEPGRAINEALAGLIEIDYRHSAVGRGYWWCGASSTGTATLFAKQGMPDPYFFSRMLMWTGR